MFGLKKKPELSIVIPVLNTRKYLDECLDSVRIATQNLDAEILIVDNGSTDGSIEFIQKYIAKHKKFRLLHQETPGPGAARNKGVEAARGKYIAFVDSDDFVAPDIYERMLQVARDDDCDMVVCNVIRKKGNKFIHSELHRKAYHNLRNRKIDVDIDTDLAYDCTVWNRIILSELFKNNSISFPDAHYCEDFPVVQQLYCLAHRVRFIQKWGYCWRYRSDSITSNITRKHLEEEIAMLRYLKENALKYSASDKYLDAINYKSLALEFASCIATLRERDTETAREFVELISSYIEEDLDLEGIKDLSLYNQQKIKYLLDRDKDSLIILSNYLKANYLNAPVVSGEDGFEMILPENIFNIESRSFKNEFNNAPFWLSIDTVDVDKSSMTIHTHVYVRRINMPDFSYQNVRAFLINDLTGAELELKVEKEMRPSLTKARGEVLNHDDYRLYHYNYDGTGIAFTINIEDFADKKEFSGWSFILLECDNAVGHKNLVLRFGTEKSLQAINSTELKSKNASVRFSTDEIEVFGITVDPVS